MATQLLMIEAEGNYNQAGELIEQYGTLDARTTEDLENLMQIPRDLDLTFKLDL